MKLQRKSKNKNNLTFREHLKELKRRVKIIIITFIVCYIVSYIKCQDILDVITKLSKEIGYDLVYIAPQEVIIQQLRMSGVASLLICIPIITYEVLIFLAPIFKNKKRYITYTTIYCLAAIGLFIAGLAFAYKVMLPFIYKFLYTLGETSGFVAQISLKEYITLFITVEWALGFITEMPLICTLLSKLGILKPDLMIKLRPFVIVLSFIIGALITPPDVISQIIVALPMIALYQVSIIICRIIYKNKLKKLDKSSGLGNSSS